MMKGRVGNDPAFCFMRQLENSSAIGINVIFIHNFGAIMELVHNERTKYLAAALDRASTACLAVGAIGQLTSPISAQFGLDVAIAVSAWISGSLVLHLAGRIILGGLRS
jgi:hypothetical protein